MTIAPVSRRWLGTAYYPEHWPESRWAQDAGLLRDGGISVVRMMEFAWDKLEPSEGHYNFEWIDRALQIFKDANIKVVLCTPTATPPPWLTKAHPDILRTDDKSARRAVPGSRRSTCCNVPALQEATDRIVKAIAEHWGQHPNVVGWQIDNEFGCHGSVRCVCDFCKAAFQTWCNAKYSTLEALNAAWGTQFWSGTYSEWDQIPVPVPTTTAHNPGLLLDYRRFSSDSWVSYQRRQIDVLRHKIGTERFITHNFMLRFDELDYFDLARDLDFVSVDSYPHGLSGPIETAFNLDLIYGLKNQPFWVMEQQPGPINWPERPAPVAPGQVRTWTHQAFGHGAEAVCYFRERAVNIGQEQYHSGIMKHDGSPDRCWYEAKQVTEDLQKMPQLTRPKASVALIFDYHDRWTIQLDPHNREFSYYGIALDIYRQLWAAHIPVDILPRDADLTGYAVAFVPSPMLINEQHTANWRKYVEQGGKLVVTFRAFVKNQGNTWTDQPMPAGGLSDLLGVTVDEFLSIPSSPTVGMRHSNDSDPDWNDERGNHVSDISRRPQLGFGESFSIPTKTRYHTWVEVLKPTTAERLMYYSDGYYKDGVAATMNRVGQGEAYLLGCWCDPFIPRTIWQALDLQKHAIAEHDSRNPALEVIGLRDEQGRSVELRINHHKRTVILPEAEADSSDSGKMQA